MLRSSPDCIHSMSVNQCSSILVNASRFLSTGPLVSTLNCSLIPVLAELVLLQSSFQAQSGSEGSRLAITSRQCDDSCFHLQARRGTGTNTGCPTAGSPDAQGSFWTCFIYEYRHVDTVSMPMNPYGTKTASVCMQKWHSCTQGVAPTDANTELVA